MNRETYNRELIRNGLNPSNFGYFERLIGCVAGRPGCYLREVIGIGYVRDLALTTTELEDRAERSTFTQMARIGHVGKWHYLPERNVFICSHCKGKG